MKSTMTRRNWIKASALLSGGATFLSSALNTAEAKSNLTTLSPGKFKRDEELIADFPKLKARLFANENPFGPSAKAKKAIQDAMAYSYQYPFITLTDLKKKIAEYEGVKEEQVMLGAGSSPLLQGAAIYFSHLNTGGNIITGDPSYDDLPSKAEVFNSTKWVKVPLTKEHKLDLDAMEKAVNDKTSLVYICNPNNPTGTILDTAQLKAFCERVSKKVPVFIDEAYIDYLSDPKGSSMLDCVKKGQNIFVARTFSKLYGFAGLRVGYVIAQEDSIKKIEPYTSGWGSISATSAAAAVATYNDKEFLSDALKKTIASKEYLYSVLKKEGYEYIPSSTNFVMFPVNMNAERFTEEMMKRGVGVRPWQFAGKEWCRVSIGLMEEMQIFADAFKQIS
jgi:histidinol-phosphate aminotransferase